jgi:fibronectin-binding autotransporter adhesin
LTGPGSLSKIGSGTLVLAGSNTYAGPTTIKQGTLVVNGSLISQVTVNSGGTLGGTGSLASVTVNAGGHLAPGNSPGTLTLTGSLSLLSGSVMDYELGSPTTSDQIWMPTGQLVLSGQQFSDFNFTPPAGLSPGSYTLINAGSISGNLGTNLDGTIAGLPATLAINGNDLVLNVVPEPGTVTLLLASAASLYAYRRRQKSAASIVSA